MIKPVGIIQKNKDWNLTFLEQIENSAAPVGIIQKNKDWNFIVFISHFI